LGLVGSVEIGILVTKRQLEGFRGALLGWFARARRDLPWRRTRDPYAIWISEILLQQTRVAAVEPYYLRFLRRFPDVGALARARLGSVLKLWEGLGYYSRARNLHAAAKIILRDFGGRLPETAKELQTLPGVGRYTAGAIASIAFARDEPVLDGNVERVLCRAFRIHQPPKAPATRKELWSLAEMLPPPGQAGDFNQALMELGALVCLPRTPRCDACPLRGRCGARRAGEESRLPVRKKKKALPHHTIVAAVIRKGGRILIDRRKPDGLLGGLWEFPGGKARRDETLPAALRREVREEVDIGIRVGREIAVVRHAYSHFRITMHVFDCRWRSGQAKAIGCADVKWVFPSQLRRFAFPRANHNILDLLTGPGERNQITRQGV
jgi:A/G-specific adenine glycosylase